VTVDSVFVFRARRAVSDARNPDDGTVRYQHSVDLLVSLHLWRHTTRTAAAKSLVVEFILSQQNAVNHEDCRTCVDRATIYPLPEIPSFDRYKRHPE